MKDNLHSILLIEDNQDDYEALVRGFKATNIINSIEWYKSTEEAIIYFNEFNTKDQKNTLPSLIILDLNLPGLDGRKMLEYIKSNPKIKKIPVIILTTSSDQKDVNQCYEFGSNTYIQKPVNFEQMKKICLALKNYWFDSAIFPAHNSDGFLI